MKTRKCFRIRPQFVLGTFCLFIITTLFWSCDKLKGITTIYGTVYDEVGAPVDSIKIAVDARKGFLTIKTKSLATVFTDKNGKYEVTVDAPRGYGDISCYVFLSENPKFTSLYRAAKPFQDGKGISSNSIAAGTKVNVDFKLLK